jgi:hypothetical protein
MIPAALRSDALIQASPKAALMSPPATLSSMPALQQHRAALGWGGAGSAKAEDLSLDSCCWVCYPAGVFLQARLTFA